MINVMISDAYADQVTPELLERAAQAALKQQANQAGAQTVAGDLSVVIEDDARLHALNQEFLGIDAPTDVLSFPSGEDEVDPETGQAYLGDVIISFPRALEQSTAAGHSVQDELQLLVVHGVLHLLGHDHAESGEKERMWSAQSEILGGLDVRLNRLPE
jgi:probable rRNA maturation factor